LRRAENIFRNLLPRNGLRTSFADTLAIKGQPVKAFAQSSFGRYASLSRQSAKEQYELLRLLSPREGCAASTIGKPHLETRKQNPHASSHGAMLFG